jgi:hypothetical protein
MRPDRGPSPPQSTAPARGLCLVCCALVFGLVVSLGLESGLSPVRPHVARASEAGVPAVTSAGTLATNWDRLRSMPREQRLALWEKLKAFDALGQSERSSIRALDARIAALSPADRDNYASVLRRYHHWLQGLTDEQRTALITAPPSQRMRLVTGYRADVRTGATGNMNTTPMFLQVFDFSGSAPFETAHRLKVWFDLSAENRAEIEAQDSPAARKKRLTEFAQHVRLGPIGRVPKSDEDALMAKLESNPQLKNWLANPLKKADPTKHEKVKRRIAANYYFLEHPPTAVDPGRLRHFGAALPTWDREQLDPLPPEEAKRRLAILYRLVFPAPKEFPESFQATPTPKAGTPPAAHAPAAPLETTRN